MCVSKVICVRFDIAVSHFQRFNEKRKGLVCYAKIYAFKNYLLAKRELLKEFFKKENDLVKSFCKITPLVMWRMNSWNIEEK